MNHSTTLQLRISKLRRLLFVFVIAALSADIAFASELDENAAQAIAEALVHEPVNKEKVVPLASPKTLRLQARYSTLTRKITGLSEDRSGLRKNVSSLDDRLSRLGARVSEKEVRISLESAVLFAFDRAELRPDAIETLREVVDLLKEYPRSSVLVEGHTCSMGTEEYNLRLSQRRATAVATWIEAHSKSDVATLGLGESQPLADNEKEEGRRKNRRVEIVIRKM